MYMYLVCDQAKLKPVCSATESLYIASLVILLFRECLLKALIRLCGSPGLFFPCNGIKFSHKEAYKITISNVFL